MMKKYVLVWFAVLTVLRLCGEEPRVVSLSPALTELISHLGRQSALVGRSSACDMPQEIRRLPIAGQYGNPAMEKLVRLKPQIVFADVFQDVAVRRSMEAMGIRVVTLPLNSFAEYRKAVQVIGSELHAEQAAAQELARVDRFLAERPRRHAGKPLRVMVVVWHSPLMLPGRDSFLTEYIRLAGGVNIGREEARDYFRAAPEWILKKDPEVVLWPGGRPALVPGWWKNFSAGKSGRIRFPAEEGLYFRLSPRFDQAVEAMEKAFAEAPKPQ